MDKEKRFARVAHLVERLVDVEEVPGSIPGARTTFCKSFLYKSAAGGRVGIAETLVSVLLVHRFCLNFPFV